MFGGSKQEKYGYISKFLYITSRLHISEITFGTIAEAMTHKFYPTEFSHYLTMWKSGYQLSHFENIFQII